MKNLLIITQKVDEQDDLLGFFVDWIREFSKKFDKVSVITLAKGTYNLPNNVYVYSLGKERGSSKFIRLVTFYRLLFTLTSESSGIFAHMSPIFVISSWPVAFIFRKKIIFWYLHRSVTAKLKLAEKLSYKIVTAAKESLKFKSDKIIETGHGINLEKFKTERNWSGGKLRILSVGRISEIKNYETILEAAKILKDKGIDFEIKIIGKPVMDYDLQYFEMLKSLVASYKLQDCVQFVGFVPHDKIPDYYKQSDICIGALPSGGVDKVMLEAMASGCIVITSNDVFRKYLGSYGDKLIFSHRDFNGLAEKIEELNQTNLDEKKKISDFMVKSTEENHSLGNAINKLTHLYE